MPGRAKASPSEVTFNGRLILSPHRRQPAHFHTRHSNVRTPYPSYAQLTMDSEHHGTPLRFGSAFCRGEDSGEGGGGSYHSRPLPSSHAAPDSSWLSHVHQHHRYRDPFTHHSVDTPSRKCGTTPTVSALPAPSADDAHAHCAKLKPCFQAYCIHCGVGASTQQQQQQQQQQQGCSEVQGLPPRSQRWATNRVAVEDQEPEDELTRHRCRLYMPPPSSLPDSGTRTTTPTVEIMHFDTPLSQPLSSCRATSRLQRLLRKLEAEAQRTSCTVTDVPGGTQNIVKLYQTLFLQALADGAAWERHARSLESSAKASAKREAHLKRELRHVQRSVELLLAYVKRSGQTVDDVGRGNALDTGVSTQTGRAAPNGAPSLPPDAPAAGTGAMVDAAPSLPSSASIPASSELIPGSMGRSLNLAYSGGDSRHGEDYDGAEAVAIAASKAAVRKMDDRPRVAVAKRQADLHELDSFDSESLSDVHKFVEMLWDHSSWNGNVDDSGTGWHTRYEVSAAQENTNGGAAVQWLCGGDTEEYQMHMSGIWELSAAVHVSGMPHGEPMPSLPHHTTTAESAASPESGTSPHATTIDHAIRTGSMTHESTSLDSATEPHVSPPSAAYSLLEILRGRDTSSRGAEALGQEFVHTPLGTMSKTTSQIAPVHENFDYEVSVTGATRNHGSSDDVHLKHAMQAKTSFYSSASRSLLTPSSSFPRQGTEPKGETAPSHAASLPLLGPSSQPRPHSHLHVLEPPPPQMPCVSDNDDCNSTPPAIEASVAAATIAATELVYTLPALLSFPRDQTFASVTTTSQRDDGVAAQSDDAPENSLNKSDFLERASFADGFGTSSSSSPVRQLEEAHSGYHRLTRSCSRSDVKSDNMTDDRSKSTNSDGYAAWRAQLEGQLDHGWVAGM
ncbi:hypothetical protein, unknown function [Leishmania tarentolae]|uniref:Uncharacterized protein n=1 Tax=Leishmania tarentolae TaxID=5689 RepID=A0A640KQM9_LEITA|nr:hypothetical protein, unknown function [Leishmania tarentolae]